MSAITINLRTNVDLTNIRLWSPRASAQLGAWTVFAVVARSQSGLDVEGQTFRPYSTRPYSVMVGSPTAQRLAPKGGVPILDANGARIGTRYPDGYRQYKRESRGTDKVDLILSGQMYREFRVKSATEAEVVVGLTGQAREYGSYVDADRPWIGIGPDEEAEMDDEISAIVERELRDSLAGTAVP